jgi:hypothetical protein
MLFCLGDALLRKALGNVTTARMLTVCAMKTRRHLGQRTRIRAKIWLGMVRKMCLETRCSEGLSAICSSRSLYERAKAEEVEVLQTRANDRQRSVGAMPAALSKVSTLWLK